MYFVNGPQTSDRPFFVLFYSVVWEGELVWEGKKGERRETLGKEEDEDEEEIKT